jgi:flagellar hook-basal body complex protein FliE
MQGIQGLRIAPPPMPTAGVSGTAGIQGAEPQQAFKDFLLQSIDQVNGMQNDANHAVQNLMTGGNVNPAEVLTTVQKADMAFRMMLQIRNKLVQAYQEVKDVRV